MRRRYQVFWGKRFACACITAFYLLQHARQRGDNVSHNCDCPPGSAQPPLTTNTNRSCVLLQVLPECSRLLQQEIELVRAGGGVCRNDSGASKYKSASAAESSADFKCVASKHVHTRTRTHTYMRTCICSADCNGVASACVHTRIYSQMHTKMHTCMRWYMRVRTCACCMHVCIFQSVDRIYCDTHVQMCVYANTMVVYVYMNESIYADSSVCNMYVCMATRIRNHTCLR